jgi:uncharacterized membrane protein
MSLHPEKRQLIQMQTHRHLHALLLLSAIPALVFPCAARADEAANHYKFSDSAKPGILKIRIGRGNVVVSASDGQEITVASDSSPAQTVRPDGLRVLSEGSGFTFAEEKNVASLDCGVEDPGGSGDFRIAVPRNTGVVVNNLWGGNVTCSGIIGDLDIRSLNGRVRLDDVSGGALVESTNGEIRATIREIHDGRPLSFTSVNGAVSIRVPADAKANVRLRTQNGKILTDFDEKALVTKTEMTQPRAGRHLHASSGEAGDSGGILDDKTREAVREAAREAAQATREAGEAVREAMQAAKEGMAESGVRIPMPPAPPPPLPAMTGGKTVTGLLNGGGPEVQATTVNGDVILRKIADHKP